MKKLFAVAVGIVVILSLTLAMPAMAAKPTVPNPIHHDVNFVTGSPDLTADPIYQIQVPRDGTVTITILPTGGFVISDPYATDLTGAIKLESGKTYDVYAQIRSKPGTSASIQLSGYEPYDFTASKTLTDWMHIGQVAAGSSITFDNDISDPLKVNGSSNFATRWFEVPALP